VLHVRVVLAPGEVDEFGVGRGAVDDRVAVLEVAGEFAEGRDLGRADEGEVLGPEEDDLPFAGVVVRADRAEGGLGIGRDDRFQFEVREFLANAENKDSP